MPTIDPKAKAALEGLSVPKRRFVLAYCGAARGNTRLAAKMAGVDGNALNQRTMGNQWMRNTRVRAAINAFIEAYAMNAAELTASFQDLAEANVGPFVEWNQDTGALSVKVPDDDAWEAHKHWIKSIKADAITGKVVEFQLHNRMEAMRDLAKILKLYSDAPIFAFNVYLQNMSDAELLRLYEDARSNQEVRPLRTGTAAALGPGANGEEVLVDDDDIVVEDDDGEALASDDDDSPTDA